MMGEPVQQSAGESFGAEGLGPLTLVVRPPMPGDDVRATTDDNFKDITPDLNIAMRILRKKTKRRDMAVAKRLRRYARIGFDETRVTVPPGLPTYRE